MPVSFAFHLRAQIDRHFAPAISRRHVVVVTGSLLLSLSVLRLSSSGGVEKGRIPCSPDDVGRMDAGPFKSNYHWAAKISK